MPIKKGECLLNQRNYILFIENRQIIEMIFFFELFSFDCISFSARKPFITTYIHIWKIKSFSSVSYQKFIITHTAYLSITSIPRLNRLLMTVFRLFT